MVDSSQYTLYSGGHAGTEEAFGICAERWGCQEVNFSYEGHKVTRDSNVILLTEEELSKGDVSMAIVSQHMGRNYAEAEKIRRIIRQIYHIVTNADQLFAVGWILDNDTVKGGTGWGVELAKFFNREVSVYDQEKGRWFTWTERQWREADPRISASSFAGTGTRNLNSAGRDEICRLFENSFGPTAE